MVSASKDRRQHPRHKLAARLRFVHLASGREFPARSVDVSSGGVLIHVPATAPIRPGHRLRLDASALPDGTPLTHASDVDVEVLRLDRKRLLDLGYIPLAARFVQPPGNCDPEK